MTVAVARIDLAYDGAGFHGWQVQPGLRTVQGELAAACSRLLGREVLPAGAGRTDTGVHALGQVASVAGVTQEETARLARVLPRVMPEDTRVLAVRAMPDGFSARFSARWRRYRYRVGLRDDLFQRRYRWFPGRTPDLDALTAAAAQVVGTHDFASFCKAASLRDDNTCCVTHSRWERRGDEAVYTVQADRFLHHMVRNLVGTMVEMASGRRPGRDLAEILAARDRAAAGTMAPPHGLYLAAVGYDEIDGSDTANDHPSPEERA